MTTHELTSSVSAGPITDNSYLFGARTGSADSAPDVFLATVLYDYIKSKTDTLYPTIATLSSVSDVANNALNQASGYWRGESMPTTGFAAADDDTGLATKGQMELFVAGLGIHYSSLDPVTTLDTAADLLQIWDDDAAQYKSITSDALLAYYIGSTVQGYDAGL